MPKSGGVLTMCGIAGAISFIEDMRDDMKTYENMQKSMIRRGPDQRGMVISREAALIHTRLAVIDIEGGRQPMSFGDYTIVYNGELYGFTTHSDTEVVLKAFIRWGEDCVEKLNGIFAFVIYDNAQRRAFIARDRIGVKPLFYFQNESKLIFASELPTK